MVRVQGDEVIVTLRRIARDRIMRGMGWDRIRMFELFTQVKISQLNYIVGGEQRGVFAFSILLSLFVIVLGNFKP